ATASLLVASAAAGSSADWTAGLTGSLTSMGWTQSASTSDSHSALIHRGMPEACFLPWAAVQEALRTTLASDDAGAIDHGVSVLSQASAHVAGRWQTATSLAANHVRATLAVIAQTGEDPRLAVVVVDLTYLQTPAVAAAFPWGQWPSAGATLTQTTSLLVIDAAAAAALLAALTPKVGAVLGTDVLDLSS
ncbi:MAG: hypothetical protein ACOYBU_11520, partial [Dermatophilaceae bacterium]